MTDVPMIIVNSLFYYKKRFHLSERQVQLWALDRNIMGYYKTMAQILILLASRIVWCRYLTVSMLYCDVL